MHHLPLGQTRILKRVCVIIGLGEVAGGKFARVRNDQSTSLEINNVGLECCRIHRDEHVRRITCGFDRIGTEVDLKGRYAEKRSLRRANLGRKVGEGREIISGERRRQRELPASKLHSVPRIASKADDDRFGGHFTGGRLVSFGSFLYGGSHQLCPAIIMSLFGALDMAPVRHKIVKLSAHAISL